MAEKREKKRERDLNRCEETIRNYKQARKKAKKAVAKVKGKACDDLYTSLEEKDGQLKAMRIAEQKNRESQDMYQVKQMKNKVGQVLLDEEEIKERWRSYFKQLMNVKNDRNERVVEPGEETAVEEIKKGK